MAPFSMARYRSRAGARVRLQRDAPAQEGTRGPRLKMSSVKRYGLGYVNGRQTSRVGTGAGQDSTGDPSAGSSRVCRGAREEPGARQRLGSKP